MKEEIKKVFYCDYCNKRYFARHACKSHEDACSKRPENKNPCLDGCIYLEDAKSQVYRDGYYANGNYFEEEFTAKCFKCTKKSVLMFPYTAERLNQKYDLEAQGQEPMPKVNCEFFKLHSLNEDIFKDFK